MVLNPGHRYTADAVLNAAMLQHQLARVRSKYPLVVLLERNEDGAKLKRECTRVR